MEGWTTSRMCWVGTVLHLWVSGHTGQLLVFPLEWSWDKKTRVLRVTGVEMDGPALNGQVLLVSVQETTPRWLAQRACFFPWLLVCLF